MNKSGIQLLVLWAVIGIVWTNTDDSTTRVPSGEPVITISSIIQNPYLRFRDEPDAEDPNGEYEGLISDMLQSLKDEGYLPNYEIVLVKDGRFGSRDSEGNYDGMIGEVLNMEADFAAAPLSITSRRQLVVNFTQPWADVAYTLVANRDDNVESLETLAARDDVTFGTLRGGATYQEFQSQKDAPYSTIYAKMSTAEESLPTSISQGLQRAADGKFVFIMENFGVEWYIGCYDNLESVDSFLSTSGYGFAFPRPYSSLKGKVEDGLAHLKESGTLNKIVDKWFNSPSDCSFGVSVYRSIFTIVIGVLCATLIL